MGKYLLDNVHAQFPEATLGLVVASRGDMIRDVLAGSPYIDVIETNRRDVFGLLKLWWKFHGSDLVVTQYAGKVGGQFALASKVAARLLARRGALVGFEDVSPWNTFLYNGMLPVRNDQAVAEHERWVLQMAEVAISVPYPQLVVPAKEEVLTRFQLVRGTYVIVHLFAGNAGRGISPVNARELLVAIRARMPDLTIVLSGGSTDRKIAGEISEDIAHVLIVAGSVSLQEMMPLISGSRCVVSVDTGIAHIAASLGQPLLVIRTCLGRNWWFTEQYGPEAHIVQFTREDVCTPHIYKNYPDCINMVSMKEVATVASA